MHGFKNKAPCALSVCLCVILGLVVQSTAQLPEADIELGKVIGITEDVTVNSNTTITVNKFLGIQFAKPPVGELRFSKPVATDRLEANPYNASYHRAFCPNVYGTTMDIENEDCLYLNVYAPNTTADEATGHAVMVWVFGGGFQFGSSNFYNGSPLAALGNVILVTLNYRVSVLGFLSTYDEHAPGNYGLHDQQMAFRWVQDNIGAFGGDKDRVTIFGGSAGSMSVSLHGFNPDNSGLFQRVLAESGTATCEHLELSFDYMPKVHFVATAVGCPIDENKAMIDCLRNVTVEEFKQNITQALEENPEDKYLTEFKPVIDGDVVKYDYMNFSMLNQDSDEVKFFQTLDYMTGVNAYEGGLFTADRAGTADINTFLPTREQFYTELIPTLENLAGISSPLGENGRKALLHEYTNWTAPFSPEMIRIQYAKVLGDVFFVVPAIETSYLHVADNSTTFMYRFVPRTSSSSMSPTWLPGSDHGGEGGAVWGLHLLYDIGMPDWEIELSSTIMTYWTNFAKSGSPNSPDPVTVDWPTYDLEDQRYMELNRDMGDHSRKQYLGTRETEFWREILPGIVET